MKKLSLLLSMLMIVGMFGTTASAYETDAAITLTPDKTTVQKGDIVTITVGATGDSNGYAFYSSIKVCPKWDTNDFEYVGGEVDSSNCPDLGYNSSVTLGTGTLSSGYIQFNQPIKPSAADPAQSEDVILGTFQLKAISDTAKTSNITLATATQVKVMPTGETMATKALTLPETLTVPITIEAAGPAEPTTVANAATKENNAAVDEAAGEFLIADSPAAVAYWAEGAFTSGKSTAYWSATIDSKAATKNINVGNASGNVKFGVVITGATSVSDVYLNVVTQN